MPQGAVRGPPVRVRRAPGGEPGQGRRGEEALRAGRRDADTGKVRALLEQEIARLPDRPVLGVGPVERFELPPAREERQQRTPQPQHGSRAQPGTAFEDGPEHREVQGDPLDTELLGAQQQFDHHELHEPVVGVPVAAHQVQ